MTNLLKKLCEQIGVSGRENNVCEFIKAEVSPFCDKIYTDRAGNLICEKKGKKPSKNKVMLCAHMDEVGFIITSIRDDGLLKFSLVGGMDERLFLGKRVTIASDNKAVFGCVNIVPTHLLSDAQKAKVPSISELCIDVGAENKGEAEVLVSIGDTGVLSGDFERLENGRILARALDDRCGCAVLISLLKEELEHDLTVCFTVQEEVGCRGAQMCAEKIKPDIALVIDSTTACDIQNIPSESTVANLEKGGVVSFMDGGCIYDRELFELIMKTAEEKNIPAQLKRAIAGANDSASIHKCCGGIKTAAISLPCRYIHSAGSVVSESDLYSTFNLVKAVLPKICEL